MCFEIEALIWSHSSVNNLSIQMDVMVEQGVILYTAANFDFGYSIESI